MLVILVCAAALVGLSLAEVRPLPPAPLGWLAMLALAGASMGRRRAGWRGLGLTCCAAALGGLRGALAGPLEADPLARFGADPVVLQGLVASGPVVGERADRFGLAVEAAAPASAPNLEPLTARLTVIDVPDGIGRRLVLGDRVQAEGRLAPRTGPGQGRGPPRQLLFPRLRLVAPANPGASDLAARLRSAAARGIRTNLPQPQAALATGVLLGGAALRAESSAGARVEPSTDQAATSDPARGAASTPAAATAPATTRPAEPTPDRPRDGGLSPAFRQALGRSGLAHLVAIDGYKQVMVAGVLGGLVVRLVGRRLATLPILAGIAGYTLLTGAPASAVRAGLMVGLATLAAAVGRVPDSLTALLLAALLMAAVQPIILLDLGFQLSFSATLGLILLWPRLGRLLRGVPRPLAEPAGLTLAVSLATLPVTLSAFQQVSFASPLAHIVAAPLVPLVLVTAGLLALGAPLPGLAAALGWLAWLPTSLLAETIQVFGGLPGAALPTGRLSTSAAVVLAAILLAWGAWELPELAPLRGRLREALASVRGWRSMSLAVALALGAGAALVVRPDGRLHVQALPVGRGQAVFVRGPTGATALVVGGALDSASLADEVADRLHVWEHSLGAVVLLDDQVAPRLAETLRRYPADRRLDAWHDARLDLAGGLALDVYADGRPSVALAYRDIWIQLAGWIRPPPSVTASIEDAIELVSDGHAVWAAD